jgi:hypothetical protein
MRDWLFANLDTIATVGSAVLTAVALFASWRSWRRSELRRDDVLEWANAAIAAMQSVRLITGTSRMPLGDDEARQRMAALMFETSILVERGRLFFRNSGTWKRRDKPHAYRGKRPEILDQLVVAHQIACSWPAAMPDDRKAMGLVAEDVLRRFVSLVQMEVGRMRTASADTRRGGDGADLRWRIRELDPARLEKFVTES